MLARHDLIYGVGTPLNSSRGFVSRVTDHIIEEVNKEIELKITHTRTAGVLFIIPHREKEIEKEREREIQNRK